MKRHTKLSALPIAAALALAALAPVLAVSPGAAPQTDAAQAVQPTGTPAPMRATSADDLAKVKSSGKLLVGVSADYPPYEFYNSNYKIDGFDPALMSDLAKRIGARSVDLNDFAFEGLLTALELGQVDVAISAISVTPERREMVDFTNVYYIGADAVLAAKSYPSDTLASLNDLAGKRVGAEKGTVYATFLKENLVDKNLSSPTDIFLYGDISSAVRDLKDGKFDLLMLDRLPARNFAQADSNVKVVGESFNPQRFAMAVRKGSNLRGALNDALLKAQNDGTVAKLIEQYLGLASNEVEPVTPVTPEPTPTPGPTATPAPPACVDGLSFVQDLNYDDQNMTAPPVFQPGQSFRKGWRVRNSGNCPWPANYTLRYIFGNTPAAQMGGQSVAVGRVVQPGNTADIYVNLIAPGSPGTYQGFWQMYNTGGTPFGERMWVGITVPAPPTPTPQPQPTPVPGINFTANPTVINQGQCTTFNWNVQGVNGVWFFPAGQAWQNYGVAGVSSSQQCPQQTTTYYLRVQFNDGSVQQPQITISVNPVGPSGPVISRFSADPSQIIAGQTVNLQWQVNGPVTRIVILRNGAAIWDGAPTTGSYTDTPPGTGTVSYGIQAYDTNNQFVQTDRTVIIGNPGPQPPIINSFTVNPTVITGGQCVLISWDASGGATRAQIYRDYITQTPLAMDSTKVQGQNLQDCPPAQPGARVGYRIEVSNPQGQTVIRDVVVAVVVR